MGKCVRGEGDQRVEIGYHFSYCLYLSIIFFSSKTEIELVEF